MTFRIDGVGIAGNRWYCLLKGVRGDGNAFGVLMTGPRGEGLLLVERVIPAPGQLLLEREEFYLPLHLRGDEAKRSFANAMLHLGWGPEVRPD